MARLEPMKICLGILAHNEETHIVDTLGDLIDQDLWRHLEWDTSLLVVVNGSSDRTAERARQFLANSQVNGPHNDPINHTVIELPVAGKANAWNRFVHDLAPSDVDVLLLADADIRIPQPDALTRLVQALQESPTAVAAVDQPIKDIALQGRKSLSGHLSLSASTLADAGPPKLCGQLYAARADALRAIFLPEPMLVEDGFIKAMLVTQGFSQPEDRNRLVRAEGVYHVYEAEMSPSAVFRHEKRILIGTLSNLLLFDKARELSDSGIAVGAWMRSQTQDNPGWFRELIHQRLGRWGGARIGIMIPVPIQQLSQCRGVRFWRALPGAVVRVALNVVVAMGAAIDLRLGRLKW